MVSFCMVLVEREEIEMKLKITKIESIHNKTQETLGKIVKNIKLNNTSLTLENEFDYILRTSSVKEIIIKTNNSIYTLERIDE